MGSNRILVITAGISMVVGLIVGTFASPVLLGDADSPLIPTRMDKPEDAPAPRTPSARPSPSDSTTGERPFRDTGTRPDPVPRELPQTPARPSLPAGMPDDLVRGVTEPVVTPTGTGQINGRVMQTGDLVGIPGVLVEAFGIWKDFKPVRPPQERSSSEPRPLPEFARIAQEAIERERLRAALYYYAHTDAEGRFAIVGLPEGAEFRLNARGEGWSFQPCDEDGSTSGHQGYNSVDIGSEACFIGTRRWEIEVEVLMPDGTQAENVMFRSATWPSAAGDADPEEVAKTVQLTRSTAVGGVPELLVLTPGEHLVRAELQDSRNEKGPMRSQVVRVSNNVGPTPKIVFQLVAETSIIVTVASEVSSFQSYRIAVAKWDGSLPPPNVLRQNNNWLSMRGKEGTTLMKDIEPGSHVVALLDSNTYQVLAHEVVSVSANTATRISLDVPPKRRDQYAVVWVRVTGGETPDVVRARAGYRASGRTRSNSFRDVRKQPDGSFHVDLFTSPEEPPQGATFHFDIHHNDLGQSSVEYTPGPATEATVQFNAPAMLTVTVDGVSALGSAGQLDVRWNISGSGSGGQNSRPVRVGDSWKFPATQPGTVEVSLWYNPSKSTDEGSFYGGLALESTEVSLRSGDNHARVSVPRMSPLTISAPGAVAGANVHIQMQTDASGNRPRHWFQLPAIFDAQSRVVIDNLPYGTYRVATHDNSFLPATVTLPQDSMVILSRRN